MAVDPTRSDGARTIEVFADIWCPFAHVGLRCVAEARDAAGRPDVVIRVRAWPLELVNDAPMDPAKADHHAHDLREQVAPHLFAHLDVEHFPTSTLEALALTEAAYRVDAELGERTSLAVRDALFEEGRDICDPAVVADLAATLGVPLPDERDRAAVLEDWQEGRRRGVIGSPHFYCGPHDLFCPSLDITRDDAGLTIRHNTEALEAFLADCLAG
jgi:predicted DsbA family dithiol-disulfide isomerase